MSKRGLQGGTPASSDEAAILVDTLLSGKGRGTTLLNPGPVVTTSRVKAALVQPDICHREKEFEVLLSRVSRKLARVFRAGPEHEVLLITGSGTAGMEAAITSTVPRGRKLLVVSNGSFGERLAEIAETHFLELTKLRYAWGEPVDPRDIERALAEDPSIAAVAMIHHETSVGMLNPVTEVGALCARFDKLYLVDTVASLGAEDVNVVRDHIDVCFSSSGKCLHAMPGIAVVCVNVRVWERIQGVPPRSYYLDLRKYHRYAAEAQTPFTPAIQTLFALDAAVDELLEGGLSRRLAIYRRRNRRLRAGLRALGCEFFDGSGRESCVVTTVRLPAGFAFGPLAQEVRRQGYVIYDCKPPLQGSYFQIANMGDLTSEAIDQFVEAFAKAIGRSRNRRPVLRLVDVPMIEATSST